MRISPVRSPRAQVDTEGPGAFGGRHGVLQMPLLSISSLASRNNHSLLFDIGAQRCKATLFPEGVGSGGGRGDVPEPVSLYS